MDVLICAALTDAENLLDLTVRSILRNFEPLNSIYIVTNGKSQVQQRLTGIQGLQDHPVILMEDRDVLSEEELCLEGWVRQQIIKMRVDTFTQTENVCIIGADTVLLQKITWDDLMIQDTPVVYFNRDRYPSIHLEYERARLVNMAKLLQVAPQKSYLPGNFIMELIVFNGAYLWGLRDYLKGLYGDDYFLRIAPRSTKTLLEKLHFSEWALYSIYLLDVAKAPVQLRLSTSRYMAHIHSENYYKRFGYDAKIVHFVAKDLNMHEIRCRVNHILGG